MKLKKILLAHVHIRCSFKNTIVSLTKRNGNVLKQWSIKSFKKIKNKRNIPYNIHLIVSKLNKYVLFKKIKKLNIFFKGDNVFVKRTFLNNCKYKKLKIKKIFTTLLVPFNGCRKKKKKRK